MIFNAWKLNKKDVNVTHCLRLTLGQVITADMLRAEIELNENKIQFNNQRENKYFEHKKKQKKKKKRSLSIFEKDEYHRV